MFKDLLEKLAEFDGLDYPKPDFSKEIADLFIAVLNDYKSLYSVEINDIQDGSYFGRQCVVSFYDSPRCGNPIEVELAWDVNQIVVYTSKHNGFWAASYTTEKTALTAWNAFLKDFLYV